ncbi:unnamed protein product [Arctia plantaginis]|uniref:Uncharacterized protein n=1 Tax=Arctia plantaginis TaxID=874455 RepID=A0A8S0ZUJ5_ARCPL|nr:unnamed protein product [Arctia plantaginis]
MFGYRSDTLLNGSKVSLVPRTSRRPCGSSLYKNNNLIDHRVARLRPPRPPLGGSGSVPLTRVEQITYYKSILDSSTSNRIKMQRANLTRDESPGYVQSLPNNFERASVGSEPLYVGLRPLRVGDGERFGRVQRDGGLRGDRDGAGVGRGLAVHVAQQQRHARRQRHQLQRRLPAARAAPAASAAVLVLSDLLRGPHFVRLRVGVGVRFASATAGARRR